MIRIDIRPVWRFRSSTEKEFDFQLVALLAQLEAHGKLTQAAEVAGISYRHAWNLIAQWEAFFGAPLVAKAKGRGSTLTPFGRRVLFAGQRAQARLAPELENLAAEFARSLNESLTERAPVIVMQASHDYAVAKLRDLSEGSPVELDLQYKGSFDALAALRRGECDIAGFHVPEGALGALMEQRYRECLPLHEYRLISFVTRAQGLIVRAGNPKGIAGVEDLCRPEVRMVNRQRGSGTRALLEFLVTAAGLDRARMGGYECEETTHGAVAALIAGHQADVGFGVEAAAAQYRLDFVPVCRERYYLACRAEQLAGHAVSALRRKLKGAAFRQAVASLAGYRAEGAGTVLASFEPIAERS
ncbi:MAG TPA: substrate-binding domain-containing protein [Usitatibacter sp.]|nr:substrate-binding domain-containing protein [Usitatibacter sp.]